MSEKRTAAEEMRHDLGFYLHLAPTPEGVKQAEKERDYLEQTIKEDLPKLSAGDVFMVYLIVGALTQYEKKEN